MWYLKSTPDIWSYLFFPSLHKIECFDSCNPVKNFSGDGKIYLQKISTLLTEDKLQYICQH